MYKDNEIAQLVNELTLIAKHFHNHQSLRDRISKVVVDTIKLSELSEVSSNSWEGYVDKMGGAFTQEEIDNATAWR